ncbi:hypothetical protein GCM10011494_35060 [Novosphingobium endophyticum]|uniref:Uncharacterized protein n=1 Tax=Novosphingobium endophyticum TaxID=1955250 RepID=A0A916X705_9SPHN|nr:hypothetical protein GCM10011494_35060 [Novosphingobium endophyticum]
MVSESKATAPQYSGTPMRPIRRGPKRSTAIPAKGASTNAMTALIKSPDDISARDHPNSLSSGPIITPIMYA